MSDLVFQVSDFVALFNQTIEHVYPSVTIVGELANFRVSKNKWVYFDLKDEFSSIKFFGTVYALPGPLEDGMLLEVTGAPRLHPQFGFSITAQLLRPVGKGSILQAASLLEAKLEKEGLFDAQRKRTLPTVPETVGLITSGESAAYSDFIKILNARWQGVDVMFSDVQVQGAIAVEQLVRAIELHNEQATPPEVLVIIRGGGSPEDLAAFSSEQVTRAVAASRIPTLVAIGHENDISLAELAADLRASTPSNAAELLVPDRRDEKQRLEHYSGQLSQAAKNYLREKQQGLLLWNQQARQTIEHQISLRLQEIHSKQQILEALNPRAVLKRGYAIIRRGTNNIARVGQLHEGDILAIELQDGSIKAKVQ